MSTALLLFPDFALILLGAAIRRWMHLGDHFWNGVEKLVYFILFPALLVNAIVRTRLDLGAALPLLLTAFAAMAGAMVLGGLPRFVTTIKPLTFASVYQCGYRFNSYIALAVAGMLFGAPGIATMGLIVGAAVLASLVPASSLAWAVIGSLLIGTGMGFCNTAFLVSTQASVGYGGRAAATSSIMFMRIVGNSVGAAIFGAILHFGVSRRIPHAGDAVNRLLQPASRDSLGGTEIARLSDAIGAGLHNVYIVAGLVAVVCLALALALPARLSPTRPATRERSG